MYAGWRHTAARGVLFSFPDESPHRMRRHEDPRVRAMGVLCEDTSDGLVGAFGHWEGLDRQRDFERIDAEMAADHVSNVAAGVRSANQTAGEGLGGLTDDAQNDVAEDALTWQIVLQTHFAGFGVGCDVRVHACQAVAALARSDRGVMCVQRTCLVPLIKRLLLDPEQGAVRAAALEAVESLLLNPRGVALLCTEDHDLFLASRRQRKREWYQALVHLERTHTRHALHSDVARIMYELGMGQGYASDRLPSDRFMPLLDWNVQPWLDDGTGGGLEGDGGDTIGGLSGAGGVASRFDDVVARQRGRKDALEAGHQRKMAEQAAKNTGGPEMSTPEVLARLLQDDEDVIVVAAIRTVGTLLEGLRGSNGRKLPHEAERVMLHDARTLAGNLTRTGGILRRRKLLPEGEDEAGALAATYDAPAALDDLSRASGSSAASTPRSSRSGSTGIGAGSRSRTVRGKSRSKSAKAQSVATGFDDEQDGFSGAQKPSPVDFALDAPGLLEGLILCTAHTSPVVRSAAQEELAEAARSDDVATLARRLLHMLQRAQDWRVRVRSLEWVRSMVSARLVQLTEGALVVAAGGRGGRGATSGRTNYTEEDPYFAAQRFDELGRESVDLAAGADVALPEIPCVTVLLSQDGVTAASVCLQDMDSAAVRISALHLLGTIWDVLAADEDGGDDGEPDADSGRLAMFRECGVLSRLEALKQDLSDPGVRQQTELLILRILETAQGAPAEFRAAEQHRVDSAADRKDDFLEASRHRRVREEVRADGEGDEGEHGTPSSRQHPGWMTNRSGPGDFTTRTGATYTADSVAYTSGDDARTEFAGGDSGDGGIPLASSRQLSVMQPIGQQPIGQQPIGSGNNYAAHRWDDYVYDTAPATARFMRGVPGADTTKEREAAAASPGYGPGRETGPRVGAGKTSKDGHGRWAPFVVWVNAYPKTLHL
jgi:hypothetical protein